MPGTTLRVAVVHAMWITIIPIQIRLCVVWPMVCVCCFPLTVLGRCECITAYGPLRGHMATGSRKFTREFTGTRQNNPDGWTGNGEYTESKVTITTIDDSIVSNDEPFPFRMKDTFHRKYSYAPTRIAYERWDRYLGKPTLTSSYTDYEDFNFRPDVYSLWADLSLPIVVDWDAVAQKAVPSLRNQFNLLNFIAEADDIPALWTGIASKAKYVKKLLERRNSLRRKFEQAGRDLVRSGPDLALEWNLGYAPTIGDAQTLYENMDAPIHRAIRDLRILSDDLLTRLDKMKARVKRAEQNISNGVTGTDMLWDNAIETTIGPRGSTPPQTCDIYARCTARATIRVRGKYGHQAGMLGQLSRGLDGMGFYPDLSTLWNALPFTFLIDYVLPIGDIIESKYGSWSWAEVFNGGSKAMSIMDACVTIERTAQCNPRIPINSVMNKPDPAMSGFAYVWRTSSIGYCEMKEFSRSVLTDTAELDGLDVELKPKILPTSWTDTQRINAAALATSPFRKRRY